MPYSLRVLFLFTFIFSGFAQAKITAQFHPYDPTLQTIASWMATAESRIDIAMYSMETTAKSPVIAFLQTEDVQKRVHAGSLKIRVVFEGYGTDADNKARMTDLENLGADVRMMGSAKKVHHKFAVLDGHSNEARVIFGSANWSLTSQNNYSENILFAENEPGLATAYEKQFELLWKNSKEFGADLQLENIEGLDEREIVFSTGKRVFFNSDNFVFSKTGIKNNPKAEGYRLTRQIVRVIDAAQSEIEIATTRFKLRPVYEAVKRAAERGIQIRIILSQDDYDAYWIRQKSSLKTCDNIFNEKCSTGTSFGGYLNDLHLKNVEVRIKYYNLDHTDYLAKQMHSKYILVDQNHLLTGSFNWSVASEYSNIESLAEIEGSENSELLEQYQNNFSKMWDMGRQNYAATLEKTQNLARGIKTNCSLSPMVLTYSEVDALVKAFQGRTCN